MLLCLLAAFQVFADDIVIDGKLLDGNLYYAENWHEGDGQLVGQGTDRYIITKQAYDASNFTVDATMALDVHNSTAVTFCLGKYALGLDGSADNKYFFEIQGVQPVQRYNSSIWYTPGQDFSFRAVCTNGEVSFFIDDELLFKTKIDTGKPLSFGFRPQRNTLRIRSFTVDGKAVGENTLQLEQLQSVSSTIPALDQLIAIDKDQAVCLKSDAVPFGRFTVRLQSLDSAVLLAEFTGDVMHGLLTIPADFLRQAFESQAGKGCLRTCLLTLNRDEQTVLSNRLTLYNPEANQGLGTGRIVQENGRPCIDFNGEKLGTLSARMGKVWSTNFIGRAVKQFSEAGVHCNNMNVYPHQFMSRDQSFAMDWKRFFGHIEQFASRTFGEDPSATFVIYYELNMPSSFVDLYPDEVIRLDNGVEKLNYGVEGKLQPSYASETWRRVMGQQLRDFVELLKQSPLAERVVAIRLCYANCGEWNHWGYHEGAFVDYSKPMQNAFRHYLQTEYGTDARLQQAWGRNDITLDSDALIPSRENRLAGDSIRHDDKTLQQTIDYYKFFQLYTVNTIEHFAKAIKEASDNKMLVSTYYGYYWGHYGNNPYHFQDSGNYAISALARSPFIDFAGGPSLYNWRKYNAIPNGLTATLALHNKIWMTEGDMRNHRTRNEDADYGVLENLEESIAVLKRNFATEFAHQSNFYLDDFVYDWYRDEEFMDTVAKLVKIDQFLRRQPNTLKAEVALILSEESIPYMGNRTQWEEMRGLLRSSMEMDMWGAPFDTYSDGDLDSIDFTQYKAVIFMNNCFASDKTIQLVRDRVMQSGRTVLFFGAPAAVSPELSTSPERMKALTGIAMVFHPETPMGTVTKFPEHTPRLVDGSPQWSVEITDEDATPVAQLANGTFAGAKCDLNNAKSIVVGHPVPNPAFIRHLLRKETDVHIYSANDREYDWYFACGSMLAVFSREGGSRSLVFPQPSEIIADMFTGEILATDSAQVTVSMPKGKPETRYIFTGSRQQWNEYLSLKIF